MIGRPLSSTLFPYTMLFRSHGQLHLDGLADAVEHDPVQLRAHQPGPRPVARAGWSDVSEPGHQHPPGYAAVSDRLRSEEHTSELQSHRDLVCRLLLEKKIQRLGKLLRVGLAVPTIDDLRLRHGEHDTNAATTSISTRPGSNLSKGSSKLRKMIDSCTE